MVNVFKQNGIIFFVSILTSILLSNCFTVTVDPKEKQPIFPGPIYNLSDTASTLQNFNISLDRSLTHKGGVLTVSFSINGNKAKRRVVDIYLSNNLNWENNDKSRSLLKSILIDTTLNAKSASQVSVTIPTDCGCYNYNNSSNFIQLVTKNNNDSLLRQSVPIQVFNSTDLYLNSIISSDDPQFFRYSALTINGGNFNKGVAYIVYFTPLNGLTDVLTASGFYLNNYQIKTIIPYDATVTKYKVEIVVQGNNKSLNSLQVEVVEGVSEGVKQFPYINSIYSPDGGFSFFKNSLITINGGNFDKNTPNIVNFKYSDPKTKITTEFSLTATYINDNTISFQIPNTITGLRYGITISNSIGESIIENIFNIFDSYSPSFTPRIYKGVDSLGYDLTTGLLTGVGNNLSMTSPNIMYFIVNTSSSNTSYPVTVTVLSGTLGQSLQKYQVPVPSNINVLRPISLELFNKEFGWSNTLNLDRLFK